MENPLAWPSFFKYFRQLEEKQRPGTFAFLAPRLYNCYNHAHVPDPNMCPGPGPGVKCSKTVEVRCSYSKFKPCQQSPLTKSKKKKKNSAQQYKKRSVSALTDSVPRKMAAERQKDSAPCGNLTLVTRLATRALTTQPLVHIN